MRAQPKVMLLVAVAAVRVTAQTSSWELSDPTARIDVFGSAATAPRRAPGRQ